MRLLPGALLATLALLVPARAGDNAIAHQSAETMALTNCLQSAEAPAKPIEFAGGGPLPAGAAFGAAILTQIQYVGGLDGFSYAAGIISLAGVDPCSPEEPFFSLLLSRPDLGQDPVLFSVKAPTGHPGAVVAHAMSSNAVVVGHVSYDGGGAFRWTADDGMEIIVPGVTASANAVTPDGETVAGQLDQLTAFRWTRTLGPINLGAFVATGISDDGTVIAGTSTAAHQEATRWVLTNTPTAGAGVATGLGFLGSGLHIATFSEANAISGDGTVIVGDGLTADTGGIFHAFKVVGTGTMEDLGTASGLIHSKASAVSQDGSVIVGTSWSNANNLLTYVTAGRAVASDSVATRWTSLTGAQDLNGLVIAKGVDLGGYRLLTATGVSSDGQFISGEEVPAGSPNQTGTTSYVLRYCDDTVAAACAAWTARIGAAGAITGRAAQQRAVDGLAADRSQIMTGEHGFAAPLLGDTAPLLNQVNSGGVHASFGSLAGGLSGRYDAGGVTLIGGIADASETYAGASMSNGFLLGGVVRAIVPFKTIAVLGEFGGWFSPAGSYHFSRRYVSGSTILSGEADTTGAQSYVFGRFGPVLQPTPDDEVAVTAELGWQTLSTAGYAESLSGNPFNAAVSAGTDSMGVVKIRGQWSHKFSPQLDATAWTALAAGFGRTSTMRATVSGLGTLAPTVSNPIWVEAGLRVGYHLTEQATVEGFVTATAAPGATRAHFGGMFKVAF